MASVWGEAWGASWGNAWGILSEQPQPEEEANRGGGGDGKKRRRYHKDIPPRVPPQVLPWGMPRPIADVLDEPELEAETVAALPVVDAAEASRRAAEVRRTVAEAVEEAERGLSRSKKKLRVLMLTIH